ncbi:MAG: hypothetical protein WCJ56_08955 [bacterium]
MNARVKKYLIHALWIIPLAFIVISLAPLRVAIPNNRKAFEKIKLLPGERWYLVEPCQVSDAVWVSSLNSQNADSIYFTELTGCNPELSFRRAFAYGQASGGGANRFLMIGKIERFTYPDSKYSAVLNVRKWYIIGTINRDYDYGHPWYLNIYDIKLIRGFFKISPRGINYDEQHQTLRLRRNEAPGG